MTEWNFRDRPEKHTLRLFLVRHGQTDANLKGYLQGISNGMLNETGLNQVNRLGRHLREVALDHIFASDLQRAIDTAASIANYHNLKVGIDSRLHEWNCGNLDGQLIADFLKMVKEIGKPISQLDLPGGEMLKEVRLRADEFIKDLVAEHIGESVLACSHGDLMRMMVSSLLNIDIDTAQAFYFDNASYSVFEHTGGRWKVVAINRVADIYDSQ
jgi:broad specificity phosphatase PhoE